MLLLADSLRALARGFRFRDELGISLRVGISHGPAAGAVIGATRAFYCLYGDTVSDCAPSQTQGLCPPPACSCARCWPRFVSERGRPSARSRVCIRGPDRCAELGAGRSQPDCRPSPSLSVLAGNRLAAFKSAGPIPCPTVTTPPPPASHPPCPSGALAQQTQKAESSPPRTALPPPAGQVDTDDHK